MNAPPFSLLTSAGDPPLYDLLDQDGRLLLVAATSGVANRVANQLSNLPDWTSNFRIRLQLDVRARPEILWDWRYEGPLELLAYSSDVTSSAAVLVRSHVGRCGLELEEAVRRLCQFTEEHQNILIAVMAERFGFDPDEWPVYLMTERA